MTAALAAEAGADVTVLGPSMPADHLQRRLAAGDIDVLALSCTVPSSLLGAQRCVAAGHAAGLPVVVGGRAFAGRQQRARAIGADLLTDDPARLCELPPAAGEDVVVPEEALRLDAVPDATVGRLIDGVVAAFPSLAAAPAGTRDAAREDLRWIVPFTSAAVLTDDPTVLDDFLASLLRMLHGRVSDDIVLSGADVVADGIGPLVPHGAAMLRDAVRRARQPS
jgi:hypothetical protein